MNPKLLFSLLAIAVVSILMIAAASSVSAVIRQATPTVIDGAINAGVELIRQDMYIRLTQQYLENQRIETGARMTATQQVFDATATQARYEENTQATKQAGAATQQAFEVTVQAAQVFDTATAQAKATATQMAVAGLTATVEARATEQAVKQTEQAPAIAARQTAVSIESQKAQIELQKSRATMWVSAWGGWVMALFVAAAAAFVIWKKSQFGIVTDENGKVRIVMINQRALNPALMHDPVIDFSNRRVTIPALGTPAEYQRALVHERNIVDAIGELPHGYPRQALGMTANLSAPQNPAVNIQVVQPGQVQGWIDDVTEQIAAKGEED